MAQIRIYNEIVNEEERVFLDFMGVQSVSFNSVDDFIANLPQEDESIDLQIDCKGGLVSEGWKIYDALRTSGKSISAQIVGECSSMATIVLMAAPKEARSARQNARLLIHNPFIPAMEGHLDADTMRRTANDLDAERNKFIALYVERTGAEEEEIASLMDKDEMISAQEALRLGFVSSIISPNTASNINTNTKNMSSKFMKACKAFADALGYNAVAMELTTDDGQTLTIKKESGEPKVGDEVENEDGEYKMPDGNTIVVEGGVITEIRPAEEPTEEMPEEEAKVEEEKEEEKCEESEEPTEDVPNETEELKKENEELKAQIEELKKQLEEAGVEVEQANAKAVTKEQAEILNAVAIAGGKDWLKKVASDYKAEQRSMSAKPTRMSLAEYLENKKK